jgi:general secretion pathway protein L
MSRQILAIDIRNDAIAAVLLSTGLKNDGVQACAHMPIMAPSDDGDPLSQTLAQLLGKMNPTGANVVISLPSDNALYRFVTVPFKEENKIRQILPFELEPTLPVSVENLKFDFQKSTSGESSEIMAVAMDQTVFQSYMNQLAAADIRPQLVVPGAIPLVAQISALEAQHDATALFLDVDIAHATLFALRSGRIEMARCLPSGPIDATSAETLALRIRQTLTAWSDKVNQELTPAVVYASGPGLEKPGVVEMLAQALEIPIQTIDLSQWLTRVEVPQEVGWRPNLMNDALALAELEAEGRACINFHRISSPLRNYWSAYKHYITGPAILLALVVLLASSGVLLENHFLKKQVNALDAQLVQLFKSTFPNTRLKAPPLDQMKSELKEMKKSGSGSEQGGVRIRSIDVLLQISQSIPDNLDVVLSRMTIGADEITISGETADFNSVNDMKSRLEKNELFKQITIASANMDKSGHKVLFKLKIDL